MTRGVLQATLVVLSVAVLSLAPARPVRAALDVVVTSAADDIAGECPHESNCTLRAAIELINIDESDTSYTLRFDPAVFPPAEPVTITLVEPLPTVVKDNLTLDGTNAGVIVDGSAVADVADGLAFSGGAVTVRRVAIRGFGGVCVSLLGDGALVEQVGAGDCSTGIFVGGANSLVRGNVIGLAADGSGEAPVGVGILVHGSYTKVGDDAAGPGGANAIGNASVAIQVGTALGPAIVAATIAGNIIGTAPLTGDPAPVGTAVLIHPPSGAVEVTGNAIANVQGDAIVVGATIDGTSSLGNRFSLNRFENLAGMAIDLGANGIREPNDPGDEDEGPNSLLNHPVLTRAVQSQLEGTACPGCRVEIYHAHHSPGGATDYPLVPLDGGVVTASGTGHFEVESPPVTPGEWIVAVAIDAGGNTSEFSPSTRVGAGVAQCGEVALPAGWNLAGYFGQGSLPLGDDFPPNGGASDVGAIFRLIDGTTSYQAWFPGPAGRTLHTLETGEAYWMHTGAPVTVPGGFSLTVPLPVSLKSGWNEFVYIGASAAVADALSSIAGKYTAVHGWSNALEGSRWRSSYPGIPSWAHTLQSLETCHAYSIFVTEDVTLVPPQP